MPNGEALSMSEECEVMQGIQLGNVKLDVGARRDAADADRQALEALIDEIASESFPASDPPAWGVAGERLQSLVSQCGGTDQV